MGIEVAGLLAGGLPVGSDLFELADAVAGSKKTTSVEGVEVRTLDEPAREPVHGWIDFSRPAATVKLLETVDRPVVIATTGFDAAQREAIERAARRVPVLVAPNTSPGVRQLYRLVQALRGPDSGFEASVVETHHAKKKDAPSGTAKALVERLRDRGYADVTVAALRAGGVPGEHEIRLVSEDEMVVLSHRVWNRRVFARGAVDALHWLLRQKKPRLYAVDEIDEVDRD
jgi:4-hydroxy-tetrahydrodipicolinate reductase